MSSAPAAIAADARQAGLAHDQRHWQGGRDGGVLTAALGGRALGDDGRAVAELIDVIQVEEHLQCRGIVLVLGRAFHIARVLTVPLPREAQRIALVLVVRRRLQVELRWAGAIGEPRKPRARTQHPLCERKDGWMVQQ